jgi:hypothetical protein
LLVLDAPLATDTVRGDLAGLQLPLHHLVVQPQEVGDL